MSKTIQFRCVNCQTLLFKYEIGKKTLDFIGMYARFIDCPDGKKDVICSKCNTRQEICKGSLRKIELAEV